MFQDAYLEYPDYTCANYVTFIFKSLLYVSQKTHTYINLFLLVLDTEAIYESQRNDRDSSFLFNGQMIV